MQKQFYRVHYTIASPPTEGSVIVVARTPASVRAQALALLHEHKPDLMTQAAEDAVATDPSPLVGHDALDALLALVKHQERVPGRHLGDLTALLTLAYDRLDRQAQDAFIATALQDRLPPPTPFLDVE